MKISELIKKLEEIKLQDGDLQMDFCVEDMDLCTHRYHKDDEKVVILTTGW